MFWMPAISGVIGAASFATGGTSGSTGLILASGGANINDGGSTAWATPGNITASDDVRASNFRTSTGTSQLLVAAFNLSSIPDGATITGIIARIERNYSTSSTADVRDHTLRLSKDGSTMVGANKADTGTTWPLSTDATRDYGAADDLWETTWTAAELKSANFRLMLKASHAASSSSNARVDAIWINVHYLSPVVGDLTQVWASNEQTKSVGTTGLAITTDWGANISSFNVTRFTIVNNPVAGGGVCIRGEYPSSHSSANIGTRIVAAEHDGYIDVDFEAEMLFLTPSASNSGEDFKSVRIGGYNFNTTASRIVIDDPSAALDAMQQNSPQEPPYTMSIYHYKYDYVDPIEQSSFGTHLVAGMAFTLNTWAKLRAEIRGGSGVTTGTLRFFVNDELRATASNIQWHKTAGRGWRHVGLNISTQETTVDYAVYLRNLRVYVPT